MTKGVSDMLVGMDVDKVGEWTGWTSGEIKNTCVDRAHDYGGGLTGMIICGMETDYYASGGDSGAPVFEYLFQNYVALLGVHTSTNPTTGRRFFSTLDGIEYDFGVTLDVIGDPVPPVVSITGPTEVYPYEDCTWDSEVEYGTSPFTYAWSGVLSGSESYVDGAVSSSGYLTLIVTDSESKADTAQIYIDSDLQNEQGCGGGEGG